MESPSSPWFRNLFTGMLIAMIPFMLAAQGNKKSQLQKQKAGLEKDIANTSKLIAETQKNSKKTSQQLKLIESQVHNYEELVDKTGSEMGLLDEEITVKRRESAELTKDLEQLKSQYARMVYFAYLTRRPLSRLVYLFSARSFAQAWRRMRYFREYAAIRKNQADRIIATRTDIESLVAELESLRNDKRSLMSEQELQIAELDRQKKEKDKLIKDLKKQESKLRADMKKQQQEAAAIQKKIQKIIEAEIEASRKKNIGSANNGKTTSQGNSKPANSYQMTPEESRISTTFAGNKGSLPWPVPQGSITGRFGEHPHPVLPDIKIRNNGIDITCPAGTSARAVFEGTVSAVISAPNGTRLVMIRHGEYLSVYSNIASTSLKSGSQVSAKQTIGQVSAGDDGSIVLHFEVWKEKEPQNPENWLSR